MEIYHENLLDLFEPSFEKKIRIREDGKDGIVCDGLASVQSTSYEQTMELLQKGALNRSALSNYIRILI
jgi:hypothetical protein